MKKNVKKNMHVRTGDRVLVLSGKDKGRVAIIKKVLTNSSKVVVEGVNIMTKAVKPNPMIGQQGGLTKIEAPVFSSKVMLYCSACEKPTRIKYGIVDGKKVRVCRHCNEKIDV